MATILVVDDYSTNREFFVTLLSYQGHRLLEATNGAEALEVVRVERPELIIADLAMPSMDGYEFVRQLRADPTIADTRVIFCTATYQQPEAWTLAQACGVQHVIIKPAEPEIVLRNVTEALAFTPFISQPLSFEAYCSESLRVLNNALLKQVRVLEREVAERKQREQEQEALYQLAHDLARTSDIRTVGEHLFTQAKKVLQAESGYLLLSDAARTELRGIAAYGMGQEGFIQERVDLDELTVSSLASRQKEIIVVTDYAQNPLVSERFRKKYHYLQELWSVPIMNGEQMIGVFSVGYRTPQEASAEKLRFLQLLGDEAALVLERVRLADGLREREAQLRGLFESPVVGIFFVDLSCGAITDANNAFLRMIGYQREDLLKGPIRWEALISPECRSLSEEAIEALRRTGVCTPFEKEYIHRAGHRIPVMVGAAVFEGASQTCVVFALDISERKRAEMLLQQERDFTEAILDTVGALVVVLDRQGRIVGFNRACERTTGYSFEEMGGRHIGELLLPGEREATLAAFEELLHADRFEGRQENHWFAQDGSPRLIAWSNTRLLDEAGKVEYIIATGIDITEQRKAEQRQQAQFAITRILASVRSLQEAASPLLRALCEQLKWDLGEFWTVDPDAQMLRCKTIWHVLSFEADEFIATSQQRTFLPGQSLPGHVWVSGEPVWIPDVTVDFALLRLPSAVQAGLRTAVAFPIRSDDQVIAVMGFFSREIRQCDHILLAELADIGSQIGHFVEHHRAEEALRQLTGQLLRLQDEERRRLSRELHDSTAQNLAAVAANLTIVDNATASLEPRARDLLAESVTLVQESVSEIRTLSYLLHPPLLEELGLAAALSWYVEGFTRRSGIRIHFEVPPEMTRLPRDVELALFRIVQESLTNAHRHSASPPVNIRLMRDSWQVTLTVVDQGRGLPPGLQQRIHNVDPVLGVGIAGMRERVRQLRGQLNIQSGNQGTTLTVILPVASGDA